MKSELSQDERGRIVVDALQALTAPSFTLRPRLGMENAFYVEAVFGSFSSRSGPVTIDWSDPVESVSRLRGAIADAKASLAEEILSDDD